MSTSYITKLFRQEAEFIAGAAKTWQIPHSSLPEIAFIGKSNVGKSSLINAICNRKSLAKVSHTPGRTQQINFFSLANKLILVDLPGYGFAKVPKNTKEQWERLIVFYLQNRTNLRLVNLLIDARRGIKEHDTEVAKLLLSYNKNFQIIFTKMDKINSRDELANSSKSFLESLSCSCNIVFTSARSKEGARELQLSLAKYI